MKAPPEMSRKQFNASLARNGFRQCLLWFEDMTGQCPGVSWGGVLHRNGKMARRATIAKLRRDRDAEIKRRGVSK